MILYIPLSVDDILNILTDSERNYLHEIHTDMRTFNGYCENMRRIIEFIKEDNVENSDTYIVPLDFSTRIFYIKSTCEYCIPLFPSELGIIDIDALGDFYRYAREHEFDVKIG
jgi:hypothetical protein